MGHLDVKVEGKPRTSVLDEIGTGNERNAAIKPRVRADDGAVMEPMGVAKGRSKL